MRSARAILSNLTLILFVIAIAGGLFWGNLNFVQHVPAGPDFIVPWKAMQNFMLQGVPPYGEYTALSVQSAIYNSPLRAGQNPYPVNIPLFLLIFYLPLSWIQDLNLARAIWLCLLEGGLFGVALISFRLARWSPRWIAFLILMFFSSLWQPAAFLLISGTSIILQALVICAALLSLEAGSDELAGALIALSLLNFEATGLVFLVLLVWIFSSGRWRVLGGLAMTLTILLAISFLLLPNWILPFVGKTLAVWKGGFMPGTYRQLETWLPGIGLRLAQILSISAFTVLFLELRSVRGRDVHWLFWTVCLAAALAPLLGIPYLPQWTVFTLPGLLLVISVMSQRWKLLGILSAALVLAVVFAGLWLAQLFSITSAFTIFYPLVLTILLYWVRWGAVRPPRLWADEVRLRG